MINYTLKIICQHFQFSYSRNSCSVTIILGHYSYNYLDDTVIRFKKLLNFNIYSLISFHINTYK